MMTQRSTGALLLSVLLAMLATAVHAQETRIGVAASVRPNAEGIVGGRAQTLAVGSELLANQTVRTGNLGIADLVFIDNTNLKVGPTSEVRLDKFVYDPVGSSGKVIIKMTRGAFRFVTGSQASRAYQVDTPYGTLGVRGTTVEIVVASQQERRMCLRPSRASPERDRRDCECAIKIRLVEGTETTYRTTAGRVARLTQPNQVVCITWDGNIVYSTSSESILGFGVAQGEPPGPFTPPPGPPPPPPEIVSPINPGSPTGLPPGLLRSR
jgi:hypothetical protein